MSVTGITGERTNLPAELSENVAWLRQQTPLPVCIGFGISKPDHVRMLAPVADGLIVGSAIVKRIAEAETGPREQVLAEVGNYVESLLGAALSRLTFELRGQHSASMSRGPHAQGVYLMTPSLVGRTKENHSAIAAQR